MSTVSTYDSTINSFYLAFYGRPADPSGLKFWSQQLANNNGDAGAITQAFATSEEAQVRFGSDTLETRVTEIYQQLFNRAPDTAGLAYWTSAVKQGNASLADVAIAILDGAQGSDDTLSTLRQKAADAFTAAVEAGSTQYSGYASIEAARVLVRAVTVEATDADLATLVKAAVSFADTATKTPKVVEAIATGSTLLNLYDSARGTKDPVALTQALADTAKAAAGDPVTLESLLRGGGMDKVLKVMPTKATLTDVVEALAKGGLPAAVEVVYPSKPIVVSPPVVVAPAASVSFEFEKVSESTDDRELGNNVTNQRVADVSFKFDAKNLAGTPSFKYSVDEGKTWSDAIADTKAGTVTISHLDLGGETRLERSALSEGLTSPQAEKLFIDWSAKVVTNIVLQAFDANGKQLGETTQKIVYDGYVDAPGIALMEDTHGKSIGSDHDLVTSKGEFNPVNIETGAKVEYAAVVRESSSASTNGNTDEREWKSDKPVAHEGPNSFWIRQIDAAGNVHEQLVGFTLDTVAPSSTPVLTLANDTGFSGDRITNDGTITVTNLDTDGDHGWEYSLDGKAWIQGGSNGQLGMDTIDLGKESGKFDVQVRQIDAAGNIGGQSAILSVELVTTARNPIKFVNIEGAAAGVVKTDLGTVDLNFSGAGDIEGTIQWREQSGDWITIEKTDIGSDGTFTLKEIDLSYEDKKIETRVVDNVGNESIPVGVTIDSSVNNVPSSKMTMVTPNLSASMPSLQLLPSSFPIVAATGATSEDGLANKSTLMLDVIDSGIKLDIRSYFDGEQFSVANNVLTFGTTPTLALYRLRWADDTFETADKVETGVQAGFAYFVGGKADSVLVQGFSIANGNMSAFGGTVNALNSDNTSFAYISRGSKDAWVHTGGGMDLVADYGDKMTISYDMLDSSAQDVILGFDTGSDIIQLGGEIATLIDDNGSNTLTWATANGPGFVVGANVEAVEINLAGAIATDAFGSNVTMTLETLNNALNMKQMGENIDLLILAQSADTSVLISYADKNGSNTIDASEYVIIAVADQGTINQNDIKLVGIPS